MIKFCAVSYSIELLESISMRLTHRPSPQTTFSLLLTQPSLPCFWRRTRKTPFPPFPSCLSCPCHLCLCLSRLFHLSPCLCLCLCPPVCLQLRHRRWSYHRNPSH